jgi:hypothetical protein
MLSRYDGPTLGSHPPQFTLESLDRRRSIAIGDDLGKTPIVLLFGSLT